MPHHRSGTDAAPETRGHTISWAWLYDPLAWLFTFGRSGEVARLTLDTVEAEAGDQVLDVGTGTGAVALAAAERVGPTGEVVGIDPSPEMVAKARAKASGRAASPRFEVAAIEDLPFESASFDRVVAQLMLHHLPDDLRGVGLAEVRRVLKPGGTLAVTDFARLGGAATTHLFALRRDRLQQRAHWVTRLLEGAGFEEVEQVPTRFGRMAFVRGRAPA